ncbi:MAG: DsbE family thiol:disulfide interchange protein [Dehalococcoidia bacterium]
MPAAGPEAGSQVAAALEEPAGSRKLVFLVPLLVFAALAVAMAWGLTRNPDQLPSALIGRSVPEFALAPVKGRTLGLSSADLQGQVSLVNVFASWCVPCREEHSILMRLSEQEFVPSYGINYKDRPEDAQRWLKALGDPYARTGADLDGRVAIDWGVYGIPETFVVDRDGTIAYKHIGPFTQVTMDETIVPLIRKLQARQDRTDGVDLSARPDAN